MNYVKFFGLKLLENLYDSKLEILVHEEKTEILKMNKKA